MLPGKRYEVGDILQILRRRYWLLVIPMALGAAIAAVYARQLPNRYRSVATVRVIPQQVPESMVRPAVTQKLSDRLEGLAVTILSRAQLEPIIRENNLYQAEQRRGMLMEEIYQRMRSSDIEYRPTSAGGDTFIVGYNAPSGPVAKKVADELANQFVTRSQSDRGAYVERTTAFFQAQVDEAARLLGEKDKQIQEYKSRHSGELPTQLEGNWQALNGANNQIQQLQQSIASDRDRRLIFERTVQTLEAQGPLDSAMPVTSDPASMGGSATARELEQAKRDLAQERLLHSDEHADVRIKQRRVDELTAKLEKETLERPVSAQVNVSVPPAERLRLQNILDAKANIEQIDRQMAARQHDIETLETRVNAINQRIAATPGRETELANLMRDYSALQGQYNGLLRDQKQTELSANVENGQIGEQFKIVDPAKIPMRPTSPNRTVIVVTGLAIGLGLGVAIVGLIEFNDSTFATDRELSRVVSLPVLAVVPLMQSDVERRSVRRRRILMSIGCGGAVVGCLAVLVFALVR
jgi:polysaccharide chain length determinant protein (PEP-CTERM system associated)